MSTCPIVENLRRSTIACFERGETSAELFARADRQEAANNPFSADCTRAVAQGVKRLEEERDAKLAEELYDTRGDFTVFFRRGRKQVLVVRVLDADSNAHATKRAQGFVGESAHHVTTVAGQPQSWTPSLGGHDTIVA